MLVGSVVSAQATGNVVTKPSTWITIDQGNQYYLKQDYEKARQFYDAAIAQEPTAWEAYMNRAWVLGCEEKCNLALQDLNTVLRLNPGHLGAALLRAGLYACMGNYGRALDEYNRLIRITGSELISSHSLALGQRAWLLATCPDGSFRNGKQALSDAKWLCQWTRWRVSDYIETLAAAYAETGDFDSAIRFEQQAIKSITSGSGKERVHHERQYGRLAAYERHQSLVSPCRCKN